MSIQNLGALLWLIPLAGVIIALYLLRMRRKDLKVPATFLWPERTEEIRANTLFQKLRFSWLLVLQLLALFFVVFALARPQTMQKGLTGKVTVIVVDASASMGATDVEPTRFDEAKRIAREAINSARVGDRIALIEAGPTPRVIFPLSNDPVKMLRALDTLQRSDAEADTGEALRLASALVGTLESSRIVLLSDGVFESVRDFSRGKSEVVFQPIGDKNENLAISALGVAETPAGRQLYTGVKNYGFNANGGTLTVLADGKVIDSVKLTADGGKSWGRTINAPTGAKVFEAVLEAKDYLPADNYAVALADPAAALRVLLVSRGNLFLERALALDPRVTLDRATDVPAEEQAGTTDAGKYDIVVFDGIEEVPVKARGILTFGAAGAPSPVTVTGQMQKPAFVSSEKAETMEGVDLAAVFIDQGQRVKPKASGEVVAQGSQGPLVVESRGRQRQIYVAFEPLQSDFPLTVAFPIFVANALDFLGGEGGNQMLSVRAGAPFSLPTTSAGTLTHPDGNSEKIEPVGGNLVIRSTRNVGKHVLDAGGTKRAVYATLRSDRESAIDPIRDLTIGGGDVKAVQTPARFADFWRPLALLALLILGAEWWVFARRS